MAKLFLLCATLAFFFLLTNASTYRTVVEFDEDEATNPIRPLKRCQKEFQQEQHLRACQRWMGMQMRQGGRPSLEDEDEFENPQGPQQGHPIIQRCCQELRQEEPICVCQTLEEAAKAVRASGQQQKGPKTVRRIFQTAKHLPNVCNLPRVSVCPFSVPEFPPSY